MTGAIGAHVYEPSSFPDNCGGKDCKQYTVRLRVTDPDLNWAQDTSTVISVYDPDSSGANGWGDANETVCISTSGNFTGCPAVVAAENKFTSSAEFGLIMQFRLDAGNRRILFRGGESWTQTLQANIDEAGPGLVGSYGTGKAELAITMPNTVDSFYITENDWRIQDLEMAGTAACPEPPPHVYSERFTLDTSAQVKNLLIQRTEMTGNITTGMCQGIVFSIQQFTGAPDADIHRDIFVIDNDWEPFRRYAVYGAAWGLWVLGNNFGGAHGHVMRTETHQNVLVSNNFLGANSTGECCYPNISFRALHATTGGISGCLNCTLNVDCVPFCGRSPGYVIVQDNNFSTNAGAGITAGGATQGWSVSSSDYLQQHDYVIEGNVFSKPSTTSNQLSTYVVKVANLGAGQTRINIRNNVANQTATAGDDPWDYGIKGGAGVSAYNNTCYRSDSSTRTIYCLYGGMDKCSNNVFYAPNWTGAHKWRSSTVCAVESNNFDDGGSCGADCITSPPFLNSVDPEARWEFWPMTSELRDKGIAVDGLFDDALHTCRKVPYGSTIDAGALEYAPEESGTRSVAGVPGCE